MKGQRPRPHSLMGKLSVLLTPGGGRSSSRTGLSDVLPPPNTPSDSKTRSPRGVPGQFDPGVVGLGIVAMLGNTSAKNTALFRPVDINPGRRDRSEGNHTYVTCTGRSGTLVYYNGNEDSLIFNRVSRKRDVPRQQSVFPSLEFLSSCDLCGKKLHGRDVYMYRGEKAFCSTDCRSNHMMNDGRKDQNCRSETPKAVDFSPRSPYTTDQIFSTGILAI